MANMIDYVKQYGDYTFAEQPFNDIDGVILAQLAYLDFGVLTQRSINKIADLRDEGLIETVTTGTWNPAGNRELLRLINRQRRFADISWHDWLSKVDVKKEQKITAITFSLTPDCHYISFRGTTATLIDWKEDLNMTFLPAIPSQRTALHYVQHAFAKLPGTFYLGGHSKGGNLAVYVLAHASAAMQQRIRAVYSADGPGLKQELSAELKPKVHKLIPQSSTIGLLLEPDTEYEIVSSNGHGFRQHDPYTWQIHGRKFKVIATIDGRSQYRQRTIARWLTEVDDENKQLFLDSVYDLFTATNHQEIDYLEKNWPETLKVLLQGIAKAQPQTRHQWGSVTNKLMRAVVTEAGHSVRATWDQTKNRPLSDEVQQLLTKHLPHRIAERQPRSQRSTTDSVSPKKS